MRPNRFMILVLFCALLFHPPTPAAHAEDLTMFRAGPAHTGHVARALTLPVALDWKFVTGEQSQGIDQSTPLVIGADTPRPRIIFATRSALWCVDGVTGESVWSYPREGVIGSGSRPATIRTTPVYSNGLIYVGATDGQIYAIDAIHGSLEFTFSPGRPSAINTSPILVDNVLYFGADDGGLYALDLKTQKPLMPDRSPLYSAPDAILSSPAFDDGMIYFLCRDQYLYAIDIGRLLGMDPKRSQNRALKWRYHMQEPGLYSSPVVHGGLVYLADGPDLVCMTSERGRVRWRYRGNDNIVDTPLVTDDGVYFGTKGAGTTTSTGANGGTVTALEPDKIHALTLDGKPKWSDSAVIVGPAYASPTLIRLPDSSVAAPAPAKTAASAPPAAAPPPTPAVKRAHYGIVVGCNRGFLYVFDADTGEPLWIYRCRTIDAIHGTSTPAYVNVVASPVVSGGTLYVLSDDGVLQSFQPNAPDVAPPLIYGEQPDRGVALNGVPPILISATVEDEGSGINPDSIRLKIDNVEVGKDEFTYDEYRGLIYYKIANKSGGTATRPLADGIHTVVLTLSDWMGNKARSAWSFTVDKRLPASRSVVSQPG